MLPSLPLPGSTRDSALPQIGREGTRQPRGFRVRWRWLFALLLLVAVATFVKLVLDELRTSEYQAHELARVAREAVFEVERGPSPSIRFPSTGPYDERLGYANLPDFVARLAASGFEIESQARHSPQLQALEDWGISPVYREKDRAGLRIVGSDGTPLFSTRYPSHVYDRFEDVPKVVVDASDLRREPRGARHALPDAQPGGRVGPARPRRALAGALGRGRRHRPRGRQHARDAAREVPALAAGLTSSPLEKLRQMASASLRAYQDGENTTARAQAHRARLRELDPARGGASVRRGDRPGRRALDLVRRGLREHERDPAPGARSRLGVRPRDARARLQAGAVARACPRDGLRTT